MSWISTESDLILVQNYGVVSSDELAKRTGAPSKSAVIGRARRLGLAVTREQKTRILEIAQRRVAELRQQSMGEVPPIRTKPAPRPIVRRPINGKPVSPPIMSFSECQWIHGHPNGSDWHKCGATTRDGLAFCDEHYARCYGRQANDE